jgi:hypothetical protein
LYHSQFNSFLKKVYRFHGKQLRMKYIDANIRTFLERRICVNK